MSSLPKGGTDTLQWAETRLAQPANSMLDIAASSSRFIASCRSNGNNILDVPEEKAHTLLMSDHATLRDAILYFAEFEHCKDFMVQIRWPKGQISCPVCGSEKVAWLAKP